MGPEPAQGEAAFEIKECRNGNIGSVQAILAASPGAAQWSDQAIAIALEANPACSFVSLVHGEVTGFISGRRAGSEGEILNLAVKPEFRRRRLGQALVNVVLEGFHRDGVIQVFLEVRESNHAAISFYERLGFRDVGRRGNYYHDPEEAALVLGRSLDPTRSWGK
jgi:ribosomal-protein-alanine N-acetyltransferase